MICDSGDFQIRKHLKIGNEVEGSNCFNIARLFICPAPFLAEALTHMVGDKQKEVSHSAILPEITFCLQSKESFKLGRLFCMGCSAENLMMPKDAKSRKFRMERKNSHSH